MNFPAEELRLIDLTVRMFTEPRLLGDQEMLCQAMTSEQLRKSELLSSLGVTKKDLNSNATFSRLLEQLDIEVQSKSGKNGPIPAFAKTDQFMQDLLQSSDDRVVDLVEAKLACRSSIDETRAGRLYEMSKRGEMPVYLNYCGAHTTRWSGGDAVNWQNLPKKGAVRQAIHAPPGYVIGKVDASQQECRILNTISGQWDVVEMFRARRDVYCELASSIFCHPVTTKADVGERQCGKRIELSAGFGAGHVKMLHTLRGDMKQYGIDYEVTPETAEKGINTYRATHPKVVALWKNCDMLLHYLCEGVERDCPWGLPIGISNHQIILPNDTPMTYSLRYDLAERQWYRWTRYGERKIWGGGLTENIVQALGRVAVGQAVLEVAKLHAEELRPVNLEHDAAVWVFPERDADTIMKILVATMRRVPAWLPDCPFDAEGHYGRTYG